MHIYRTNTALGALVGHDVALLVALWCYAQAGDSVRALGTNIAHGAVCKAAMVGGGKSMCEHCRIAGMHAARKRSSRQCSGRQL